MRSERYATAGDKCAECGQIIHAFSISTGRSSPPFMEVIDEGEMFDGRHICRACHSRLSKEREKEVNTILEKVYPGDSKEAKHRRAMEYMSAMVSSQFGKERFPEWKKRMEKNL